jgi:Fic family protein
MKERVYQFTLDLDWNLLNLIGEIDRFDATWSAVERPENQGLKALRSLASIQSVGASNRIEGNPLSDEEVDALLGIIDSTTLEDRDAQEVVGYFEALELVLESYEEIPLTASQMKNLHNQMLRYSVKDAWHKGDFKPHNNVVEATLPDGSKQVIFQTTEAGFATEDAMQQLVEWYRDETTVHPLVRISACVYEFLSIHPFQDGNGRLSRLLSTLLLLKAGYRWVQFVSFEREIELRRNEYYQALRSCQIQRPGEDISVWVHFFLSAIGDIAKRLAEKLDGAGEEHQLTPRQRAVLMLIRERPHLASGEIATRLAIPVPSVKRLLSDLVAMGLLQRHGEGRGVRYAAVSPWAG